MKHDQYLDAKGLNCPLPILKSKLLINRMLAGQVLLVEASDPHAKVDFEAWCARTGHILAAVTDKPHGVQCFYIRCRPDTQDT